MKRKKKSRGIITVFVTLMLVPMVVCTGTMVDAARLKLYSSQAAMVADTYGEVVLSEYDNLLKDLYGLFSVTQNEEGKQAIEDLAAYTTYSFIPNGDKEEGKGFSGFMPYKDAQISVSYEAIEESRLSNNNVLSTQIGDFMKFRAVGELMATDGGILDKLNRFQGATKEMKVVEERAALTNDCQEIFSKIGEYYQVMKCLDDYPNYKKRAETGFQNYANALDKIITNQTTFTSKNYEGDNTEYTYAQYREYLADETNINAAVNRIKDINEYNEREDEKAEEDEEYQPVYKEPTQADLDAAQKWMNKATFKRELKDELDNWGESQATPVKNLIAFGEVAGKITEMTTIANEIEGQLDSIKARVASIRSQLAECEEGSSFKQAMEDDIKKLDTIVDIAGEFKATVTKLTNATNDVAGKDSANKTDWENKIGKLEDAETKLLNAEATIWERKPALNLKWYSFRDDDTMEQFYLELKEMCERVEATDAEGDADAGNKKVEEANTKAAEETANKEKEEEEEIAKKKLRNIGDLAKYLQGHRESEVDGEGQEEKVPGFGSMFTGEASFGDLANTKINKFLLVTYNFGMFSNRVTGVEPPAKEETPAGTSEGTAEGTPALTPAPTPAAGADDSQEDNEEYKEYSLTKVEMSRDVNYLYEAELEYLIVGNKNSKTNWNTTRNIINAVRFSMNFASTFSISEINSAIDGIATAAETAVAATVLGAPLAPVVYVTVSGALRALVATLETYADWDLLKQREDVVFFKNELGDLNTANIGDYLEGRIGDTKDAPKSDGELKFSYEDYLYIMMLLFVNDNKLLDRTGNLITLNVNQSQNTSGKDLETLNFKMTDTITAIKSTCQVNLKCLIVPESMSNMFLNYGGTPETNYKQTIQKLDDGSYAYSIIRGY